MSSLIKEVDKDQLNIKIYENRQKMEENAAKIIASKIKVLYYIIYNKILYTNYRYYYLSNINTYKTKILIIL